MTLILICLNCNFKAKNSLDLYDHSLKNSHTMIIKSGKLKENLNNNLIIKGEIK